MYGLIAVMTPFSEKLRFHCDVFCPHYKERISSANSIGLKNVFEIKKLRFPDGSVSVAVSLNAGIKLCFLISQSGLVRSDPASLHARVLHSAIMIFTFSAQHTEETTFSGFSS